MAYTVEQLYRDTLGREADASGLAHWKSKFGEDVDNNELRQFLSAAQPELANSGFVPTVTAQPKTAVAAGPDADPQKQYDTLKSVIDYWSRGGPRTNWEQVIEGTYAGATLFKRGDEVVRDMINYNNTLGNPLTTAEMAAGLNAFSKSQYDTYGTGYRVSSDPFNIGRWAVAQALYDKGFSDTATNLIKSTDARQAFTSQNVVDYQEYLTRDQQLQQMAKIVGYGGGTTLGGYHMEGDSFGNLLIAVAPAAMLAVVGASALGWGGVAAGAETGAAAGAATASTEAATLAAGDAMAGLIPAETGGSIVGSNGLIGSTGNAIGDTVLNNSIQSGLTSAVSGGDPLEGALRGAAGGLISSSGVLNDVSAALTPSDAGQVATNAISRGVNAAGTAAVTGGDPVTAGLTSGIGNYVGGTVAETGAPPVVAGAAGGGAAGATGAALNGGDIGTGLIAGAAGGGASGLASQLGANSGVASGIGSIVGGVVGSELADDQTAAGPTPVGTPAPTPTPFAGMTFADMLPPEFVNVTRTTDWGSNRLATAGRI